jgi:hypothetical protein
MYDIVTIPSGVAESTEPLGTKFKFWFSDEHDNKCLFKEGRPETGENWAEKIACELAKALNLPHALCELARCEEKQGVISRSIVPHMARLVHGNELLATFVTNYGETVPQPKPYSHKEHTLRRVLSYFRASIESVGVPIGFDRTNEISTAMDVFIGYLMFDAWIANQDRHDQNWGILRTSDGNSFLADSYDHGSSMSRNTPDHKRLTMLTTKDMGQHISKYVTKARSAFFPNIQHPTNQTLKALLLMDAFKQASRQSSPATNEWLSRLDAVNDCHVQSVIDNIPDSLMSETAKEFTFTLLMLNRETILNSGI